MISSPLRLPVDVMPMPNGDVLLLPALWPVRLTRDQQHALGRLLLGEECPDTCGC